MGIQTAPQANQTPRNNQERKPADGWLNLTITDKSGKEHTIKATIPLDAENVVHKALISKGTKGETVNIVGSINVVDHNPDPIEL